MVQTNGHSPTQVRVYGAGPEPGALQDEYNPTQMRVNTPAQVRVNERPVGELFQELAQDTRTLVSLELELAKTELTQKVSETGKDAGFIAGGGFIIYAGFILLMAGIALGLANFIATWLSFLIVGIVVGLVGYMLVRKGLNGIKNRSMAPQQTVATLKEDKEWLQRERSQ